MQTTSVAKHFARFIVSTAFAVAFTALTVSPAAAFSGFSLFSDATFVSPGHASATAVRLKDSCKDGGWMDFRSAPGPFRNQGDCVSYFATGGRNTGSAGDVTPPTIVDARIVNNAATTDFVDVGDSFSLTFSEAMNGNTTGTISVQDQDGTVITGGLNCGGNVSCSWNTEVTTLTVIVTAGLTPSSGTTPGMQIPFNITALTQVADLQGNPPDVVGSADRLVDYE